MKCARDARNRFAEFADTRGRSSKRKTIKGALKSNWIFQSEAKSVNVLLYETADSDETWQPKGANQNELKLLAAMFNQWIETWGKEPRFHETLTNNWWPTIESERKLKSLSLCNASVELVRGGARNKVVDLFQFEKLVCLLEVSTSTDSLLKT